MSRTGLTVSGAPDPQAPPSLSPAALEPGPQRSDSQRGRRRPRRAFLDPSRAGLRHSSPVVTPDLTDLPVLWRTKLRSSLPGIDHAEQVEHCIRGGLIGIGWRMDDLGPDTTLDEACKRIEETPGWGREPAQTVRRFGEQAVEGDYVWTRDTHGRYWLCEITGPYRYDGSEAARRVDVHQVRDARWAPNPLNDLEVPGGVIRRFIGTGSSFSRIHDDPARSLTPYLWEKLHGRSLPDLNITPEEILASHLDPYDVEDLVYVWLQVSRNYVALPRSQQRDTPAYEWTMLHRETGRRCIVQVKTGADHVNLAALAEARADDDIDTFAFAASETYDGDRDAITEIIEGRDLLALADSRPELLPARVRTWFEMAS